MKSKYTEQQIVFDLEQAEHDMPAEEGCRKMDIRDAMFYIYGLLLCGGEEGEIEWLKPPYTGFSQEAQSKNPNLRDLTARGWVAKLPGDTENYPM